MRELLSNLRAARNLLNCWRPNRGSNTQSVRRDRQVVHPRNNLFTLPTTCRQIHGNRYTAAVIYPYDNETQTRWDRGELQVQLKQVNNDRPIAFCDGTSADEAELRAIAEAEGAEEFLLHKKQLKTGREIWTLGRA